LVSGEAVIIIKEETGSLKEIETIKREKRARTHKNYKTQVPCNVWTKCFLSNQSINKTEEIISKFELPKYS